MADHQFEQKVSQQLSDFKLKPNAEVWQQVQLQLEEDRKRRRWFFYLPLAALFIGGLLYAVWPTEEPAKTATVAHTGTNRSTSKTAETNSNLSPLTKTGSSTVVEENNPLEKKTAENNSNQLTEKTNSGQLKTATAQPPVAKVKVQTKVSTLVSIQKNANADVAAVDNKPLQKKPATVDADEVVESKQEHVVDSVAINQPVVTKFDTTQKIVTAVIVDTPALAPVVTTPGISKKKTQLGLHLNVGLSDIRGSLFPGSGYKSFSDAAPVGIGNGAPGGVTRIVQYEYAIKPSANIGVGLLLRQPFRKRNSFVTGVQYQYSSYAVTQRQRIDSFISTANMFSNISVTEKTEKFRMHSLNVPVELEFKIADIKKGALLFNAGIHNWFVIASTQTDTLSAFRYATESYRAGAYYGGGAVINETKATIYQPQLYLSPSFEWKGKKTNSQAGLYLGYGLRPAYKSATKDYWWQTGIRYRLFFNR